MKRQFLSLASGLFLIPTMLVFAQEAKPPALETYLNSASVADFVRAAQAFLENHPTSEYAPRVALDLLMVAERGGDTSLAEKSKALLLFTYTPSLQTHHVLMGFADEKAFRTFLMAQVKERLSNPPQALPGQFVKIVQLALTRFPGKLFDDASFLIMTHCLAEAAGEIQLCQAILPTLVGKAAKEPKIAPVVGICLDTQRPLVDRIHQLHVTQSTVARFPLQFYLTRLSESQQQIPRIRRIGMEMAMQSRDYPLALEHYSHLPESIQNQPQVLFWRSWALMATGADDPAREMLTTLITEHGDSVWAEPARTYLAGLQDFDTLLSTQAEQLQKVTNVLKEDLSLLQAKILFTRENSDCFMIHICSNAKGNLFEAVVEKNGILAVAYRTTVRDATFYLPSQGEIQRWPKAGPIPMPDITLDREVNGQFVMQAGLGFEANFKQVGTKGLHILESPYLSTLDGIQSLLDHVVRRHGLVPGAPRTTAEGNTEYRWLRPQIDDPGLLPLTITLTPTHQVTALTAGSIQVTSLKYGAPGSFELQTYTWPDLPQHDLEKADFAMILNMMGAVMELFKKPDPAETP
jgi:hypothetical protein